jgi:hypothetical protein
MDNNIPQRARSSLSYHSIFSVVSAFSAVNRSFFNT